MTVPLSIALAIIVFAAAFHLHWAFGGRIGFSVSLPEREDGAFVMAHRLSWWQPAAFAVATALMALACLTLSVTGWLTIPLPLLVQRIALGTIGVAFCLRVLLPNRYVGLFKQIRSTRWALYDTRFYSPLFVTLGVSLIILATA